MTSPEKAFRDFAGFVRGMKGDEKSEAQTFMFHLLEAFGHDGNTLPEGCTNFIGEAGGEKSEPRYLGCYDGKNPRRGRSQPRVAGAAPRDHVGQRLVAAQTLSYARHARPKPPARRP